MYLGLFRETERARRILEQAQPAAEAQYLAGPEPPLHLPGQTGQTP